jgi:hypothetical protein
LQNRDDAARYKRHAVEIGNSLRRQIERPARQAGKHKHSGHAENVLETEEQKLTERRGIIDANVENLRGSSFLLERVDGYKILFADCPREFPTRYNFALLTLWFFVTLDIPDGGFGSKAAAPPRCSVSAVFLPFTGGRIPRKQVPGRVPISQ